MTDTNWYLTIRKTDILGTDEEGKDIAIEYRLSKAISEKQLGGTDDKYYFIQYLAIKIYEEIQEARKKDDKV